MAAGVLVPDGRLAQSRGTHFGVAQDASLPAGAARALVQVPRLALHVKLPAGRSAHHDVHAFELAAAGLVCSGGDREGTRFGFELRSHGRSAVCAESKHTIQSVTISARQRG